jgi:hypothetical protein
MTKHVSDLKDADHQVKFEEEKKNVCQSCHEPCGPQESEDGSEYSEEYSDSVSDDEVNLAQVYQTLVENQNKLCDIFFELLKLKNRVEN